MSTDQQPHGVFGFLKQAAERFELKVLNEDAKVRSSTLATLEPHVGAWSGKMSTWLMPGDPYDVQDVTSTARWTVGGKFLERTFAGKFMGQPFEAMCLTGYDDNAGHYEAAWMDSATTAMLSLSGSHDDASRTLTLEGPMKLVNLIGATVNIRTRLIMESADALRIEISLGRLGIYVKAHQIDLARVIAP